MQVKTVDATEADKTSAYALFDSMYLLKQLFWGDAPIHALDAFARNGQLTVSSYVYWVDKVDAWELGAQHEADLKDLGCNDVRIGCSYATLQSMEKKPTYNLLVIDTPQGLHKDAFGRVRVEHFDFMREAMPVLQDKAVIVLYVNTDPYNAKEVGEHGYDVYDEYNYDRWMNERVRVYGTSRPSIVTALSVYVRMLGAWGYRTGLPLVVPCLSDVPGKDPYAFRVALPVERV